MALFNCNECGQKVSDKAEMCPNCGCPIEKKCYCEECGEEIPNNVAVCPKCGCPTKSQRSYSTEQKVHLKVSLGGDDYHANPQLRYDEIPSPSMMECVRSFFKQWITFAGRARRAEYWYVLLFNLLVVGIPLTFVSIIVLITATGEALASENPIGTLRSAEILILCLFLYLPYILFCFVGNISLGIRRLHDIGLSGWFYLIIFIPYIGGIFGLIASLIDSKKEVNKWGESPKYKLTNK